MIRTLLSSRLSPPGASPLRTAVYRPPLVKTTRTNAPATCLCRIRSFAKSSTSTAVATTTPTPSTPITSHVRREFEDELHVGRACSRFRNVTDAQIEKWKKQLGTIKPLRLKVPDEFLYPQAKYEMDALAQIHKRSYTCNVLLEIRDVRVPASSHHPSFTRLAAHRLHLICYTHADMIDQETRDRVEAWTLKSWPDSKCIFVDSSENRSFKEKKNEKKTTAEKPKPDQDTNDDDEEEKEKDSDKGSPTSSPFDMVYDSLLHHLETRGGINTALTVGVANTGKSSLLLGLIRTARLRGDLKKNGLMSATVSKKKTRRVSKHKGVVEVADKPGKTREITEYMLREKPRAFFMDVPGMTPPTFFFKERPEAWFAFGAANLLPLGARFEKDVEILSAFCGYVLYAMNRDSNFGYVAKLKLERPTTDLATVLDAVTGPKGPKEGENPEYTRRKQCFSFLALFNKGKFGPVILDDLRKPYRRFVFKDKHFVKPKKRHFKDSDGDISDDEDTNNFDGDDDEDSFYNT